MGNMLCKVQLVSITSYTAGSRPYSSVQVFSPLIDPVPLPENVTISQINTLITDKDLFSYGLKADFSLRGIETGLSGSMVMIRCLGLHSEFTMD